LPKGEDRGEGLALRLLTFILSSIEEERRCLIPLSYGTKISSTHLAAVSPLRIQGFQS
jgi:hypothetical protein